MDGRKPWEIDGNSLGRVRWEGAIRKRRVGGRTGNRGKYSMGRAPLGRSDTEATKRWTERKAWEIAGESSVGKQRYGSDERVDGWETVGNSLGRVRSEGAIRE